MSKEKFIRVTGSVEGKVVMYGVYGLGHKEAVELIERTSGVKHDYLTADFRKIKKNYVVINQDSKERNQEYINDYLEKINLGTCCVKSCNNLCSDYRSIKTGKISKGKNTILICNEHLNDSFLLSKSDKIKLCDAIMEVVFQ